MSLVSPQNKKSWDVVRDKRMKDNVDEVRSFLLSAAASSSVLSSCSFFSDQAHSKREKLGEVKERNT